MELVTGHSVGQHLQAGRVFSEAEAIRLVRSAAQALEVAHAAGLVHRDVKPDNLMLTPQGEVKLVDLGVARWVNEDASLTQASVCLGTPYYVSPEQIMAAPDVDGRADVYSLGVTFYHMLTGHPPFDASKINAVLMAHLTEAFPDPKRYRPDLTDGLYWVLRRMMARDRAARYPDMASVDCDLEGLQKTASGSTHPLDVSSPSPTRVAIQDSQREILERELARHIGPLAKLFVRRAVDCQTIGDLALRLVGQIPEESGQKAFMRAARQLESPT
jgi:serine/threonine-protein kinase